MSQVTDAMAVRAGTIMYKILIEMLAENAPKPPQATPKQPPVAKRKKKAQEQGLNQSEPSEE